MSKDDGTHSSGLGRLSVSEGDSQKKRKKFSKEIESEEESRDLTQDDPKGHLYGGGSCGWIRTTDLFDRKPYLISITTI